MDVSVQVGTANVKGGFSKSGRDTPGPLGPAVDRMLVALERAQTRGATTLSTQEISGAQAGIQTIGWRVHAATPNAVRHGAGIGNAVWWRSKIWEPVVKGELKVHVGEVRSRYVIPEDLYFPWVDLRHRETGARMIQMSVHYPAGRTGAAQRAKEVCAQAVDDWAEQISAMFPVVVAGDRNSAKLHNAWTPAESGVDFIGSPQQRIGPGGTVDRGSIGLVSDHAGLYAPVLLSAPAPEPPEESPTPEPPVLTPGPPVVLPEPGVTGVAGATIAVRNAWSVTGPGKAFHMVAQDRIRAEWPALGAALDQLAQALPGDQPL